jgi:hypothetical protein
MSALWAIRVLRKFPHTARFDRHLDNCAAHEVVYAPYNPDLPPLRVSQVFGFSSLPNPFPSLPNAASHGIDSAVLRFDRYRRTKAPIVVNGIHIVKNRP